MIRFSYGADYTKNSLVIKSFTIPVTLTDLHHQNQIMKSKKPEKHVYL